MAKFNAKEKVVNRSGYAAYSMSEKEQLVTAVLTTMFGEGKYYGSTDGDIVRLAVDCAQEDPQFLCNLACYARNDAYLRSVSQVLTCVIAREASEYTREVLQNVIIRADDILEIMACYKMMYGKPFPNAMKREIAVQIQKFDEYQIAKYNGGKREITFRDVLRITHPTPKNEEVEQLFGKVLNDTLATPYTWETEISAKGNKKEVWDELIASGRIGYMALLRNLRNIAKSGADMDAVLEKISDEAAVRKSRQMPFRFYSAYKTLKSGGYMTKEIFRALDQALTASAKNMETIEGRTLIAVDVSGSMSWSVSGKSTITCSEIAALMGAMAGSICEDAAVCYFDTGYRVSKAGKYDSILDTALNNSFSGGGTDMSLPMKFALYEDAARDLKAFDRVIYFSDCECNYSFNGKGNTVQSLVDEYRRNYNADFWVHGVDLQGYGTQQFCGKNYNLIAGWSDKVLSFISLAEKGFGSMVSEIENYNIRKE